MKNLKIKNLDVSFSDNLAEEQIKEAIDRGFAAVDLANNEPLYLVKINVGNMRADKAFRAVKSIGREFTAHGLTNCIFIPICESCILQNPPDCGII